MYHKIYKIVIPLSSPKDQYGSMGYWWGSSTGLFQYLLTYTLVSDHIVWTIGTLWSDAVGKCMLDKEVQMHHCEYIILYDHANDNPFYRNLPMIYPSTFYQEPEAQMLSDLLEYWQWGRRISVSTVPKSSNDAYGGHVISVKLSHQCMLNHDTSLMGRRERCKDMTSKIFCKQQVSGQQRNRSP